MKRIWWVCGLVLVLAGSGWAAGEKSSDVNVKADVSVGQKAGTTESLTVVQPGPDGQLRVLSKEKTTAEAGPAAERAAVPADESPRKARVAVVPAIFSQGVRSKFERELYEQWGISDPSVIENPGYTTYLVDALVNARKFDVLEREALDEVTKEIDFGESDYADMAKVVRIGQMLNADYVVIPEIRYIGFLAEKKQVPYVGQQQEVFKGRLATSIRAVDVKTSRIVSSEIADVGLTNRIKKADLAPASPVRDFIGNLYRESAIREAASLVDVAYPIKIVLVTGNTCVLNRGEGAVKPGEVLTVYKPGELMIDPDTKENLGYQEVKAGQVKVTKITAKTCEAEIIEGAGRIGKLDLCRREAPPPLTVEEPAPKID